MMADSNFWRCVEKLENGCWIWTGFRHPRRGHGMLCRSSNNISKTYYAHRFLWESLNGRIPEGMCLCHKCDNPPCVNPDHLFLGTRADNNKDMVNKGRQVKGCNNGKSKIDETDVKLIKFLLSLGNYQRVIADWFNVSDNVISDVKTGRCWSHVK